MLSIRAQSLVPVIRRTHCVPMIKNIINNKPPNKINIHSHVPKNNDLIEEPIKIIGPIDLDKKRREKIITIGNFQENGVELLASDQIISELVGK